MTTASRTLPLLAAMMLAVVACGEEAKLPVEAGTGPNTTVALTLQVDVCRHFCTQSEAELARVNVRAGNCRWVDHTSRYAKKGSATVVLGPVSPWRPIGRSDPGPAGLTDAPSST